MSSKRTHRTTAAVATTALATAVGLFPALMIGSAPAVLADPDTTCSDMAHPPDVTDSGSGNPLTRPGQLGGVNQPPPPNSDMPMNCEPIGHG